MEQVDLGHDMKVSCETITTGGAEDDDNDNDNNGVEVEYAYAPESFWVSKDEELDWLDRNAYLDRKDSGKGASSVAATSQRYSGSGNLKTKTKASLLALPKPQKQQNYAQLKNRRHARLFPNKRSEPKPLLSMNEPGSPKVSCMGRVRSRKDSRRSKKAQPQPQPQPQPPPPPPLTGVAVKQHKSGFWNNFRSMFTSKGQRNTKVSKLKPKQTSSSSSSPCNPNNNNNNNNNNKRSFYSTSNDINSCDEPPSLGGMKRFASGRKSDGWAGDVDVLDGPISDPPIWRRREVDQPHLHVQRDWRTVGPLSV